MQSNNPFHELQPGSRITDDMGITMVYVPAGTFLMGSIESDVEAAIKQVRLLNPMVKRDVFANQTPQHSMTISQPFWLDLTPVTNEAYARFTQAGGYETQSYWTAAGWDWIQNEKKTAPKDYSSVRGPLDPQQPCIGVSWYEAYAYCRCRGGRLPTEAEWEWAGRGPENRLYPWGDLYDPTGGLYDPKGYHHLATVGDSIRTEAASWVGALDMTGIVPQWVNSVYQSYPYQADDGRENNDDLNLRVVRGQESYVDPAIFLRSAHRVGSKPTNTNAFRCARTYAQSDTEV